MVSGLRSSDRKAPPPPVVDHVNSNKSSSALAVPSQESEAGLDDHSKSTIFHLANIRPPRYYYEQDELSTPLLSPITSSSSLASEAGFNSNTSPSFTIPEYGGDTENPMLPSVEHDERYRIDFAISPFTPINHIGTGAEPANINSNIPPYGEEAKSAMVPLIKDDEQRDINSTFSQILRRPSRVNEADDNPNTSPTYTTSEQDEDQSSSGLRTPGSSRSPSPIPTLPSPHQVGETRPYIPLANYPPVNTNGDREKSNPFSQAPGRTPSRCPHHD